jgi:mannose-6-phosphate isomerase-like protein (cupin superfamily)
MTSGFVLGPGEGSAYGFHGSAEVFCGEERWSIGAGSFAFVPRGQPHRFTVTAAGPARALVITGPSRLAAQIAERGEPVPPGLGL